MWEGLQAVRLKLKKAEHPECELIIHILKKGATRVAADLSNPSMHGEGTWGRGGGGVSEAGGGVQET